MWTLETPWYELVIRAAAIFTFVFIVTRLWGKKHFGELSPFDFILLLIMSEGIQNALVDDDHSLTGGMITILTLVVLNSAMNRLTFRFRTLEKIIDGTPKVLIEDGKLHEEVRDHLKMTDQELEAALRLQGVNDLKNVKVAVMETNGKLSVIQKH